MELIAKSDIFFTFIVNLFLPHNLFTDYFFSFFSLVGNSVFLWLAFFGLAVFLEERKNPGIQKKDINFALLILLSFFFSLVASSLVLKNLIKRPRPSPPKALSPTASVKNIALRCPTSYSFPSTHATTAFATAGIIAVFDKRRKYFYYFLAFLIALSRVYLNCHYFFDIVSGAFLGYLIAKLILKLAKKLAI